MFEFVRMHVLAPVAIGWQRNVKMLQRKITFLDLLRIVFSFLVAGDFYNRATINTFQ